MENEPNGFAESDDTTAAVTTAPVEDSARSEREESASRLVGRFAIWSGAAGIIPVPLVDIVAVAGLQLEMLRRLSGLYDVAFSENRGKALIASLAGSLIPASSGIGAASALKIVPVFGTLTSGLVMPVLAAGATYAIGMAFVQHFESGGTLLDFNPPDYREFVRVQREKWDSRYSRTGREHANPVDSAEEAAHAGP